MDDGIGTVDQPLQGGRVGQIANDQLEPVIGGEQLRGMPARQDAHVPSLAPQGSDNVAADEAGCAGYGRQFRH
jgi:hypothetical protein